MDVFKNEWDGTRFFEFGDVEVIADNVADAVFVTIDNGSIDYFGRERGTFKFTREEFAKFIAECQWVAGQE